MGAVAQGGGAAGDGEAVERVGVETVLDAIKRLNERRLADGVTDAQTGEGIGFGQRADNQQIRQVLYERYGGVDFRSRLDAEFDIVFFYD